MLDVVPPAQPRRSTISPPRRTPRRQRVASSAIPQTPGPRVVALQYRLPARLRRPIREELARERQKKKQEQSIVAFERRPIYSQVPDSHPTYGRPKNKLENRGAEHHTGDVYYHSRPNLSVEVPPYRGRVVPATAKITPPAPIIRQPKKAPVPAVQPRRQPKTGLAALGTDVRDVPYRWTQALESKPRNSAIFVNEAAQLLAPITQPKRRFTLPLHFSVFPWRKKNNTSSNEDQAKKKRYTSTGG